MKIVSIYSEMPNQGLDSIMKVIYNTFHELNVNVEKINLKDMIPFYEGNKIKEVTDIILNIQQAEACILATSVNMFLPIALMKAFLEHCTNVDYQPILLGKNYMTVAVSNTVGERETSEYLSRVIAILGGAELGRISIGGKDLSLIDTDQGLKEAIEKNVEDFYRILRQNRRNFVSSEAYIYRNYNDNAPLSTQKTVYNQEKDNLYSQQTIQNVEEDFNEIKTLLDNVRTKSSDIDKLNNGINFNISKSNTIDTKNKETKVEAYEAQFEAFTERQEEDIKDITRMFAKKMNVENELPIKNTATYSRPVSKPVEVVYREKTCKQMMQSLPHHFQSHLASGIKVVFQFSISGEEVFEGYLNIENCETSFTEGISEKPDIFIYTTSNVMKDVLRNKYSTQKAFMTGQLKVRGNFVLLNKLDQLYKKMP